MIYLPDTNAWIRLLNNGENLVKQRFGQIGFQTWEQFFPRIGKSGNNELGGVFAVKRAACHEVSCPTLSQTGDE